MVFGGLGSISGSVVAAVLLELISSMLQSLVALRMIICSASCSDNDIPATGTNGLKEISGIMFKESGRECKVGPVCW